MQLISLPAKLGAKFWLPIVAWLLIPLVYGDSLELTGDGSGPQIPHTIAIYEDLAAELTFPGVLQQAAWQELTTREINKGLSNSAWWIKFSLQGNQETNYLLSVDSTLLEKFDIWLLDQSRENRVIEHHAVGTKRPVEQRPIAYRKFLAPLDFSNTEQLTILLRVESETSIVVPLEVWQSQDFWRHETWENILYGVFLGAISLIAIYNLLLFVSTRDWAFFYYVIYSVPLGFTSVIFEGFGILYLWPSLSHLNTYFLGAIFLVNGLGMLLFARAFLNVPSLPRTFAKLFDFYLLITAIVLGLTLMGLPFRWVSALNIVLFLGNIIFSITAGLMALYLQKNPSAKYFLMARSMLFIGGVVLVLGTLGAYQNNAIMAVSVPIGALLEVLFLSFALANRINIEKSLRQKADEASIEARAESRAKSRFLASMSHEIRTPMNGIIGVAQLLSDTQLTSEQRSYLSIIKKSGSSLLNIINEILDLSKIDAGKMTFEETEFDLRDLVEEAVSLFTFEARKKNLQLQMNMSEELPNSVVGDPTRVRQILINLLGNAIKFTHDGEIKLSVLVDDAGKIRFEVSDTGIGIPRERVNTLFQAFEQADDATTRKFGGTGLGLTICKQLAHLMGGDIGVNSQLGKGSKFWFTVPLPAVEKATPIEENQPTQVSITERQNLTIGDVRVMVVEDNEVNQLVIRGLLAKLSVTADVFSGGEAALAHYQQNHQDLNLVLMDCEMPGMDGYECTQKLRAFEDSNAIRPIPVYALTAHAMREHREKSISAGMNGHLAKPIAVGQLEEVIQAALRLRGQASTKQP